MTGFFQPPIPIYAGFMALFVCVLAARVIVHVGHMSFDPRGRLGCIDGLRGLLALGVYLHHYVVTYYFHVEGEWKTPESAFYALSGHVGVALFFMVTGFLFWIKILSSGGKVNWRKLYLSRFFRLVPLFWCVVVCVLGIVFIKGGCGLRESPAKLLTHILEWFTFVRYPDVNRFSETSQIIAYVAWTLRYEWVFYFSLPLLAWILAVSRPRPAVLVLFVVLVIVTGVAALPFRLLRINTQFFLFFLSGAFTAYIYTQEKWREYLQGPVFSILALAALVSVFLFFKTGYEYKQAVLLTIFFIPVAMGNSFWGFLRSRVFIFLGEISYSLYLLHGFLLYSAFTLVFSGFMRSGTSSVALTAGMCLLGVILVVVAYLTYTFIEKPAIQYGKFLAKNMS